MSIASNFPAIKPTLLLDFANTEELDPRITFTRASTATYYGTETAKAEENLLLSSQVSTPAWGATNGTISAATQVAPDGTTTAATFTDNTTTGTHIGNQSPVLLAGTIYTMSLFMKAGTSNFGVLTLTNVGAVESGISAVVDLSAGTISETDTGTSATFTSSSITSVGSGWYRVVITGSSIAGFNRAEFAQAPAATGNVFSTSQRISYTGTGTTIFVWGAQLEQRSAVTAYTPTTDQTITNYIPVLETAASGVARFDHNPTTFESLGLEIEESRTNLFTYSEQFDNAAWSKTRSSVTANTIVSPDGTLDADKLVEDTTAANTHRIASASGFAFVSGTTYVFSVYAKAAENSWIFTNFHFQASGSAFGSHGAYFDLSTGSLGTATNVTSSIQAVGNGWYRCTIVGTASASLTSNPGVFLAENNGDVTIDGDGYSGAYIWGAQLEAGAFATSYIPTVASQVTRAADAASMTGTNFSSWYNAAEGTLYMEAAGTVNATLQVRVASLNAASASFRIDASLNSSTGAPLFTVIDSGVNQVQLVGTPVITSGAFYKGAYCYKFNDFAGSINAATVLTDTSGTVPVVSQLSIGGYSAVTGNLNGTIKKLAYYPLRVTNAQLQGLTS